MQSNICGLVTEEDQDNVIAEYHEGKPRSRLAISGTLMAVDGAVIPANTMLANCVNEGSQPEIGAGPDARLHKKGDNNEMASRT